MVINASYVASDPEREAISPLWRNQCDACRESERGDRETP